MTDVGLQPVDGQDHAARGGRHAPEPLGVGEREGEQLIVAVQQVGDGAEAGRYATADQLGMDLGDTAVPGMAQGADQGDDVEAELVLRQGEAPLRLGAQGDGVAGAVRLAAAPDLEPEADRTAQGRDRPPGLVGRPERCPAGGAGPGNSRVWSGRGRALRRAMALLLEAGSTLGVTGTEVTDQGNFATLALLR